ncbi:hypothetical protein VTN49DRAFT_5484 [Thermomyces lanuginosus]|uniref:uncharacterized protein n=1 Tax=Thermomyces lanuginosus TaxID=5541 RepID=UPI0037429552
MAGPQTVLRPRISKSCDQCKARKVRCIRDTSNSVKCKNCLKRGQQCHYSHTKRKLRQPESSAPPPEGHSPPLPSAGQAQANSEARKAGLYVDYLLENRDADGVRGWRTENSVVKTADHHIASSCLAFFSESRIRSVSERLGHNKLNELIDMIGAAINARMNRGANSGAMIRFKSPSTPEHTSPEAAARYIQAYFDQVHPLYPFLERKDFEEKAFSSQLPDYLAASPAFSALYHTVLALGCQYIEGGSFEPGKGKAWKLYQTSLGLFSDVLLPKEDLTNLQALIAMSIFALNLSCIQIEETLISEAARMAQTLGYNRASSREACNRAFWVIYTLEKTACFFGGGTSGLNDYDIGCPIPSIPEAVIGGTDWFLSSARFARLVSKAYETLFSVTALLKTPDEYYSAISQVYDDLERWRCSLPKEVRPGEAFRPQYHTSSCSLLICLRSHFYYYGAVIALCRLTLHVGAGTESPYVEEAKKRLMYTARQIIENTRYIDAEPYTPIWMLGVIPLSALFILFDFVVHNPTHPETGTNLALLDVAAGYFSRLEYATGGSLPSSLLSDFSHIARQYVRDVQSSGRHDASTDSRSAAQVDSYNNASTELEPPPQASIPEPVPLSYTDPLFYPTTDLQSYTGDDVPVSFDITNLFGAVIPNFPSL